MNDSMKLIITSASFGAVVSSLVNLAANLWTKRMEHRRERVSQALKLVELATPNVEEICERLDMHPGNCDMKNPASLLPSMMDIILQAERQQVRHRAKFLDPFTKLLMRLSPHGKRH